MSRPQRVRHRGIHHIAPLALLCTASAAFANGERAVLIIDPSDRESLEVGHYYMNVRNIPPANVVYMVPTNTNWNNFRDVNLPAFLSSLDNTRIADHIDFAIVPPGGGYRINSSNAVTDGCSPLNHFSTSALYTLAFEAEDICCGLDSQSANEYHSIGSSAIAFDSQSGWLNGTPSAGALAERYFIGAMLGYTGNSGNTRQEIIDMIDRSVAADGTLPLGTIYYIETTDVNRSKPRHPFFPQAVADILTLGGQAEHLLAVLPDGETDCLGIMTGWPDPDIDNGNFTILPGAFCDHLTSFAGHFGANSQTKMSRWIAKGASGSAGTVEEPCNFPGKFPTANMHVYYEQGLTLGEAAYRSLGFKPFQVLLYGDPLTRPFTHIPVVSVPDAPAGPVSGTVVITPDATTSHPSADIDGFDLMIDGEIVDSTTPGGTFSIDTTRYGDGTHDLRVLAEDDSAIEATGVWQGTLVIDNTADDVTLGINSASGSLFSTFTLSVDSAGGPFDELRIVQGSRVLASAAPGPSDITLYGWQFGPGPSTIHAEGLRPDRTIVRSAPISMDIADVVAEAPLGSTPIAYSYTKRGRRDRAFLVELPATFAEQYADVTYTILQQPSQSTIINQSASYVILDPNDEIDGPDQLTFRVTSPAGTSNNATVTLIYGGPPINDTCDIGVLSLGGTLNFDNIDATDSEFADAGCADAGSDIWFRFGVFDAGLATVELCDVDFDATLTVYGSTCPIGPDEALYCNDDACGDGAYIGFLAEPGLYRIRVGGVNGAQGFGSITFTSNPCPPDCAPEGGDGVVDIQDLLAVLGAWGMGATPCDFTGGPDDGPDGTVNVNDLLGLLGAWGSCK